MSISTFLKSFSTKNKVFYNLFENATENLVSMNKIFTEAINTNDLVKRHELIKVIKDYEHKNDNITHQIFIELSQNFITPFDREDIHALASALDDIADYIDGSSKKIMIYNILEIDKDIHKLASINGEAINEVKDAVYGLRDLKNVQHIKECCIKINGLENRADDIFEYGLVSVFENEKDAATIIKKKDILQSMEFVSDKCEDVADVISSIIVKYA
jgi:uncharacterized protein